MFRLRDASAEDLDRVFQFLSPFVEGRELLPRTRDELLGLLRHAFVGETEKDGAVHVMGFAALEIYSKKLAEIQCLAVHPDFQGRGVGQQLVARCVNRAKEQSILELMAISSSEAFLKRCGFDYSLPGQKRALFVRPTD